MHVTWVYYYVVGISEPEHDRITRKSRTQSRKDRLSGLQNNRAEVCTRFYKRVHFSSLAMAERVSPPPGRAYPI